MTRSLPAIITAARAGSLTHAWALFEAGGWDARTGDPAALAIKARLLKDRALRESGGRRTALLLQSARAYAAADRLRPQPYTRINEATMRLLAGETDRACAIAADVLALLDGGKDIAETPYFLAATRAEARLLCGDVAGAAAAMRDACAIDPDGWADRASTLRQFALILAATGDDAGWLDALRPPCSLNYAGHLGVAADADADLRRAVDAWCEQARIGFAYGALAAGADIVIAEALLARRAELHVVLPVGVEAFVAQSVAPYGAAWLPRFEACLAGARSLRCLTTLAGAYEPLATQLAANVAMGATMMNARMLESGAAQLLVIDDAVEPFGAGAGTRAIGLRWRDAASQHRLVAPRTAPVTASGRRAIPEGRADRRLAAMLMIAFAGLDDLAEDRFAEAVDTVVGPFRAASAALPAQPDLTLPVGNARLVAFADPDRAWAHARALLALPPPALPLRIAGHYALAHWLDEPPALVGRGVAELGAIAAAALPGVLTASETLAAALFVNAADAMRAEEIGEAGDIRLLALIPTPAGDQ